MQYGPLKHQQLAGEFLRRHDRCALFLDMGLGKTVVTLTRIQELFSEFAIHKALVIAPLRPAEDTWPTELAKWDHLAGLRMSLVLGTAKQRLRALNNDAEIYVINRENIAWLVKTLGGAWPFDLTVIDELSSFKSTSAQRWRILRRVIKLSQYVIGLTGTPAARGYIDLWPELYLIDGGERLGKTVGEYRVRYFNPGAHKGHIVYEWRLKRGAKEAIDQKLSDLCLSMSTEDWLELPPLTYNNVVVRLSPDERAVYEQFQRDRVLPLLRGELVDVEESESAVVGSTAAIASNKLLQMANGAVYDDGGAVFHLHDRKLDALAEIEEAAHGQPLLVFYSYKHDLERIQARFSKARVLHGAEDVRAWNAGEIPMLLCHPASAGHGLNLQGGGHIAVWFGLPWSLELYQQANKRLHRTGQTQGVVVHRILCDNTLDQRVLAVLDDRDAVQRGLLDALKGYLEETA